ncbi:MAG: histone deacetylase [Clostridia bacterium]|nr:histone deacetylase [Clostridia bacterium]
MNGNTGIIYDDDYLLHDTKAHPEGKERLVVMKEKLQQLGLWQKAQIISPSLAMEEVVLAVHPKDYLMQLKEISLSGGGRLDPDTVVSSRSYEVALLAAGGTIKAVDQVVNGIISNCFVMARPPGHHAEAERGMGFCLLNNVAIGAKYAQQQLGLKRILIVDWDAHHGNGTEKIFYNDPSVLYFSTHQSPLYPGTGFVKSSGEGEGVGYNVNVPVPRGTGDQAMYYIFTKLLVPIIEQYQPELIIISAGFDGYYQDQLAGLELTCNGFKQMTDLLLQASEKVCQGRIVACLEGGYSLPDVGKPVAAMLAALMKKELPDDFYARDLIKNNFLPGQRVQIDGAIEWQRNFWNL